jgi:hypothetical protein
VTLIALQLSVLVVAAVAAFEEVREAQRARKYGHRPHVVVDLEAEGFDSTVVVTNRGTTLARDVTISKTPDPERSVPDIDLSKIKLLSKGIPTLAPCRSLRMLVDSSISRDRGRFYDVHDDEPDSSAYLTNASSTWVQSSNLFGRPPTPAREGLRGGSSGRQRRRFARRPGGPRVVFASFCGCLTRCYPVPALCLLGSADPLGEVGRASACGRSPAAAAHQGCIWSWCAIAGTYRESQRLRLRAYPYAASGVPGSSAPQFEHTSETFHPSRPRDLLG